MRASGWTALKRSAMRRGIERPPVTPMNPDPAALSRVKHPLPVPETCPHCGSMVELVNNELIYGAPYGQWPYAYRCVAPACDSYIGLHPHTDIPLGTLANQELRRCRKLAHQALEGLWKSGGMTRTQAYAWLARQLGLGNAGQCQIGLFDKTMCRRVMDACREKTTAGAIALPDPIQGS